MSEATVMVESCHARHFVPMRPRYLHKCKHLGNKVRRRKIVLLGDMCCGKSALICAYCKDRFSECYTPTVGKMFQTELQITRRFMADFVVVDCPGREDYACLRHSVCKGADAAVLCYSTDCRQSFENIKALWYPELQKYAPGIPIMLVGTKSDARDLSTDSIDSYESIAEISSQSTASGENETIHLQEIFLEESDMIYEEEGEEMAKSIGAMGFVESSAKYRIGVRTVFEMAAKLAISHRLKRQPSYSSCNIL